MPVLFLRHAATGKNIDGGTDDAATPLHGDGVAQATETGPRLLGIARRMGVKAVQAVTSGHVRAVATWDLVAQAFAASGIDLLPTVNDPRIGEIPFLPREIQPTPDNPGLFGRAIDGLPLAERLESLRGFDAQWLRGVPPDKLMVVVGHRSTTRVLAMVHAGQTLDWLESLPRMNNCELWLACKEGVEILHAGYQARRDAPDPRREALIEAAKGQN